jgi:hypothetical protein
MVNRFDQKLSATSFSDVAVKLLARRRGTSCMSGWSRRELDGAWARGDRDDRPRKRGHLPERPAMGYVTEVSHHHAERSYYIDPCFLFYQVAALAGPTPGRTRSRALIRRLPRPRRSIATPSLTRLPSPATPCWSDSACRASWRKRSSTRTVLSIRGIRAQGLWSPDGPDLTLRQARGSEVSR